MTDKKRLFSRKERAFLFLLSGGRCEICGKLLDEKWHADHIQPFSKGGKTTVFNGQSLCADCNLKKGNNTDET